MPTWISGNVKAPEEDVENDPYIYIREGEGKALWQTYQAANAKAEAALATNRPAVTKPAGSAATRVPSVEDPLTLSDSRASSPRAGRRIPKPP